MLHSAVLAVCLAPMKEAEVLQALIQLELSDTRIHQR